MASANLTKFAGFTIAMPLHSYYPLGVEIPYHAVNEWTVPSLLVVFFGSCSLLASTTYLLSRTLQPTLTTAEAITIVWFVLSGAIHLFFEGYFAWNFATLGAKQTLLGQLWKEYAFSDSRYLTNDAFVLCMESVTAVLWGPGCLWVAAFIAGRSKWRHPAQLIVSIGQLYGDVLYYTTSMFDHYVMGITYSRPEAFYFWFYFVMMNFFWIAIPGYLIYQSVVKMSRAVEAVQKLEAQKVMFISHLAKKTSPR